jgi:hypothetical protein
VLKLFKFFFLFIYKKIMSDFILGNENFTQIQDTVYDSKVVVGLSESGILPKTYRTYTALINVTGATISTTHVVPLIDENNGQQIHLGQDDLIIALRIGVVEDVATGGTFSVAVGLSNAADDTAVDATIATVANLATLNGAGGTLSTANHLVDATNQFLTASYAVGSSAVTAGIIRVALIVV